jgi:hypothetical protein
MISNYSQLSLSGSVLVSLDEIKLQASAVSVVFVGIGIERTWNKMEQVKASSPCPFYC